MFLAASRLIAVASVLALIHPTSLGGERVTIAFFVQGQTDDAPPIDETVTIDAGMPPWLCFAGAACFGDFDTGVALSRFIRGGVASAAIPAGVFGDVDAHPDRPIAISTPSDGGANTLAIGATGSDAIMREFIGGLVKDAPPSAMDGDPPAAIPGLGSTPGGGDRGNTGLANTNAADPSGRTIPGVGIPEPAALPLLAVALFLLVAGRRTSAN